MAELILSLAVNYDAIVAPATANGKNILPRVAARLDVPQISEIIASVIARHFPAADLCRKRDRDRATPRLQEGRHRAHLRLCGGAGGRKRADRKDRAAADPGTLALRRRKPHRSERPELTAAKIVISGGRGLQSKENFALIERIADRSAPPWAPSRAAVDAGFVPNDRQVGQTGKVVAPDLYIAVGISGAIQHLAGMKDSRVIVAINKDEGAPIFQVADYGLVADLFEAFPNSKKHSAMIDGRVLAAREGAETFFPAAGCTKWR